MRSPHEAPARGHRIQTRGDRIEVVCHAGLRPTVVIMRATFRAFKRCGSLLDGFAAGALVQAAWKYGSLGASRSHRNRTRPDAAETADRRLDRRRSTPAAAGAPPAKTGRFRVVTLHASGGMGKVFVAKDDQLNRSVALKEIREQFADDPQIRDRFLREAEVTGQLEHPGIVPVYALGTL